MSAVAFLLPANEVWGKVMFLDLSVSQSRNTLSFNVCSCVFTTRKRNLGQGNIFTTAYQSFSSRGEVSASGSRGCVCIWVSGWVSTIPPETHTPLHSNTHTHTLGHPPVEVAIEADGSILLECILVVHNVSHSNNLQSSFFQNELIFV